MIIVVAHTKGGVGKSTMAWNIATALNSENIEVVDLDFQKTLTYTNEYRDEPLTVKSFETLKEFKAYIKTDSDERISIVDVGGFDSDINRMAMVMADLIITPVSDSKTELLGLKRFEKILEEISETIGEKLIVNILLNDISPQKKNIDGLKEYINQKPLYKLFNTVLKTRVAYEKALDEGLGIIEHNEDEKGMKEMKDFVSEIKQIIKEDING